MPIQLQWDGGRGFGCGSDRMGAPGSGTDQDSSSLLDSEGGWLAASAHLLHLRVCLSGCVCVGWWGKAQSIWIHDRFDTCHITPHTYTDAHTHAHIKINPLHTLATAEGGYIDYTHTHTHTHTGGYKHIKTRCSVTDGCVTHTTVLHFQVQCEQRLSEVIWGEGRQNMVLNVEKKELLIAARELEGICNRTALLILAPRTTANDKKRGGGTFYPC